MGCKWVFKRKLDANGNVAKYKARLVAQGFCQQPGLNYEATFAPVSRSTTFRLLMTLAATYDLELHQADVEGAYLNGDLDRDIFMRVPKGYTPQNPGTTALKLNKTIYGLKQSGRKRWKVLGAALEEIGFKRCESEWGLYVFNGRNGPEVLLLVYVDDLVIAAKSLAQVKDILAKLSTRWTLSHLGSIDHVLGMKIKLDRAKRIIHVAQISCIDTLLDRFPRYKANLARYAPLPKKIEKSSDTESPLSIRVSALSSPYGNVALVSRIDPTRHRL